MGLFCAIVLPVICYPYSFTMWAVFDLRFDPLDAHRDRASGREPGAGRSQPRADADRQLTAVSDRQPGGSGDVQVPDGGALPVEVDGVARCAHCGGATEASWLVCGWCGGPLATTVELPAGTHVADRFRIEVVLGRGGFGITYRAEDLRLHRRVAVKELFPPSATRHGSGVLVDPRDREGFEVARNRFRREAASLARFNHPGIVRVFEVLEANNTAYLVMELVEGRSLLEVLAERGKPFAVDEVSGRDAAGRAGVGRRARRRGCSTETSTRRT